MSVSVVCNDKERSRILARRGVSQDRLQLTRSRDKIPLPPCMPPSWKPSPSPVVWRRLSKMTQSRDCSSAPEILLHLRPYIWEYQVSEIDTGYILLPGVYGDCFQFFFFLNLIMRPQFKPRAIVTMDFARHSFDYEAGWDKFARKFFRVELVWSQRRLNPHDFLSPWWSCFEQDSDWSHRAGVFLDLTMTLFVDGSLTNSTNGQRIKNWTALSCSWWIFLPSRLSSQSAAGTHLC